MATKVKFLVHKWNGELYAFFPQLRYAPNGHRNDLKTGIVQTSTLTGSQLVKTGIGFEYVEQSRKATKNEYHDFKAKLIQNNLIGCA